MTKHIIVENGIVTNICVTDENSVIANNMFPYTTGNIGDLYEDGVITPVQQTPIVPPIITAVQLKQSLYHYGLFYQVDAALKVMNGEVYIWWLNATTFRRDDARLIAASVQLNESGLTHDLDDVFIYGNIVK